MSSPNAIDPQALFRDQRIDQWCGSFEASCKAALAGTPWPRIEDILDQVDQEDYRAVLQELVFLEIHYRKRKGETLQVDDYQSRFPGLDSSWLVAALETPGRSAQGDSASKKPTGEIPRQLGDFRILRQVGRGGMGIVYEAIQESLGRHVALKVLSLNPLLDPTLLERFHREARAAAGLHHTNIVPVFGVGEHEGLHYYAMQFIQGRGLDVVLEEIKRQRGMAPDKAPTLSHPSLAASAARRLLTDRLRIEPELEKTPHAVPSGQSVKPSPTSDTRVEKPEENNVLSSDLITVSGSSPGGDSTAPYFRGIARLGVHVAEALDYAHHHGILHRDIKPSNLLLDTSGTVWVADFGLAKAGATGDLTQPGDLVGTVRYMAPERFEGKSEPRSDVYGAGATLYEMITLRPAFADGDPFSLIERIRKEVPPRPRKIDPHIPRDLQTIVLKAMAKEPPARYATAGELAEDLRRFLADRPIRARRTPLLERTWRWCRRNPGVAGLTAVAALLLLVIAVGTSVTTLVLGTQLKRTEDAEHHATDKLWESYLAFASAQRQTTEAERRFTSLEALIKAAAIRSDPRLRNEIIACLPLVDLHAVRRWEIDRPVSYAVGFDRNLERFAYADLQGNIYIRRLDDNAEILHLSDVGKSPFYANPIFSPDGRFLAVPFSGGEDACRVWDLLKGREVKHKVPIHNGAGCRDFSPDSRWLALHRPDGSIVLLDLVSDQDKPLANVIVPDQMVFHPEGRHLALSSVVGRQAQIIDLKTGQIVAKFPHEAPTRGIAWSPDGRFLAVGCDDTNVYVYNAAEQRLQAILEGHFAPVIHLAFSSAGLLASTGWDHTTRLWDPLTGRLLLTAPGYAGQFNNDGQHLAFLYGTRQVGLWAVADGRECRTLHHGEIGNRTAGSIFDGRNGVDFSLDSRLLVSTGNDGVRLWTVDTGRELAHVPLDSCQTALFHPEGTSLITYSRTGLQQWPIGRSAPPGLVEQAPPSLQIGPPRFPVESRPGSWLRACWNKDGRRLAAVMTDRCLVLDVEKPSEKMMLAHARVMSVAMTSDGAWAATGAGSGREKGVRIWDLSSGKLIRKLPGNRIEDDTPQLAFSPDSRWLVVGGQTDYRLWSAETWEQEQVLPRDNLTPHVPLAFSPDSHMLAITLSADRIQLVDRARSQEIATFSAPDPQAITSLCFSPDGSMLAAATWKQEIQLWDLRSIRHHLADLGQDWDHPSYPEPAPSPAALLQVTLLRGPSAAQPTQEQLRKRIEELDQKIGTQPPLADLYFERAWRHGQLKDYAKSVADYQKSLELNPEHATACNNLAWIFIKGPAELRAPEKALPLAQKAVRLSPDNRALQNNLAVTYYRLGQWDGAVTGLERAIEVNKGKATAFELFFLAMSNHHLGENAKARDCFDRAITWMAAPSIPLTPNQLEELKAYQTEAETLLQPDKR